MKACSDSSCRVHFPCVLLIPVCVQRHGSDQYPFSTAKINEVIKMAVPGEMEVLGARIEGLCLSLPTIPPFISAGFTTPSVEEWPGKGLKDAHGPYCPTAQ